MAHLTDEYCPLSRIAEADRIGPQIIEQWGCAPSE
jgi:hypothetical protein